MSQFLWQQYANSTDLQHQIALRDLSQGEVFSWQALATKINQIAQQVSQQGVNENTGVALCGKNSLDLLCHYLAVLQLNGRVLGLNPAFSDEKIRQICTQADIALCLFFTPNLSRCNRYTERKKNSDFQHRSFATLPYTMTLTSGSTGLPKAVVHHMDAHLANAKGVCALMDFTSQSSWLLSLPLYHVSGQGIVWRWLLQGAELVLPSDDFYYSVTQASHISLVPTQLQRFLHYVEQHAVQQYHTAHILLGGTQIPIALTQALLPLGIQSYSGYGMTEMASTVFAKKSDQFAGVGQPLMGREFQLVDGEIWLRGAGLALGYWRDGQIQPLVNEQGWLQTKDKGRCHNKELEILGRLDNMFISGGENIQPEEIERVIMQSGQVEQVFVLPKSDPEFGQRPVALVQFTEAFSQRAVVNLRVFLADKLEKFKQPVVYFPLDLTAYQQGNIKISRVLLQQVLTDLLGKN